MLVENQTDSYPGAAYVAADPVTSGQCCLAQSMAAIAAAADAAGHAYVIRGGALYLDVSAAELEDLCKGLEPAPATINSDPMTEGVPTFVAGTLFGSVEGDLWLTDNAAWGSEGVKVQQTVSVWGPPQVDFTPVMGGLPVDPNPCWLYVENACGRANLVGLQGHIQEAP